VSSCILGQQVVSGFSHTLHLGSMQHLSKDYESIVSSNRMCRRYRSRHSDLGGFGRHMYFIHEVHESLRGLHDNQTGGRVRWLVPVIYGPECANKHCTCPTILQSPTTIPRYTQSLDQSQRHVFLGRKGTSKYIRPKDARRCSWLGLALRA